MRTVHGGNTQFPRVWDQEAGYLTDPPVKTNNTVMSAAAPGGARAAIESVDSPRRASALLNPMRLRLVRMAQEPVSATELARRLGLPRQRVNYHVRELARAGFLRPAGRRRKRNLVEQRYVATARSYVLSPEILGPSRPIGAPSRTPARPTTCSPCSSRCGSTSRGSSRSPEAAVSASARSRSSPSSGSTRRSSAPSSPGR